MAQDRGERGRPGAEIGYSLGVESGRTRVRVYYRKHLFFCTNRRPDDADRPSCAQCGSPELRNWAKARVKQLGLAGPGGVRVNISGCLDRCELGPVMVVYPDGVWYTYVDEDDLEEIIQSHVIGGAPVERLRLPSVPVQE